MSARVYNVDQNYVKQGVDTHVAGSYNSVVIHHERDSKSHFTTADQLASVELDALEPPILEDIIQRAIEAEVSNPNLWQRRQKVIHHIQNRRQQQCEGSTIIWGDIQA